MSSIDLAVIAIALAVIAGLAWFFFGPRTARAAAVSAGVQRIQVTVRGGYSPNMLQVRQNIPVEIVFDRQEVGDCSSRVIFPDLQLTAALPAHQRTSVRFTPHEAGSFEFSCGMNMIHGTLVVTPRPPAPPTTSSLLIASRSHPRPPPGPQNRRPPRSKPPKPSNRASKSPT